MRKDRVVRLFRNNPAHPGLQFKKLEGEDDIYSARIGLGYRASVLDRQSRPIQPLGLIVGAARPGDPVRKNGTNLHYRRN